MDEIRYASFAYHREMFSGSRVLRMTRLLEGLTGSFPKHRSSRKGSDIRAPDQLINQALMGFVPSLASGSYHR